MQIVGILKQCTRSDQTQSSARIGVKMKRFVLVIAIVAVSAVTQPTETGK